ncbi:uncharacterized protein PpBr36_09978 [Pyricularia pennisetigena]|uniref:uncharacterized protein n=1 Tax=Pyricularia pennisetigena TaxID=1578925 RepID=UPI00114E7358|nr:uncharacterized protein PpBr36_09978 [Pyricularia pennisetigena]TLS22218.1 hypothetical protein PpBr36_09978 [Pyricularia pennisetigena]
MDQQHSFKTNKTQPYIMLEDTTTPPKLAEAYMRRGEDGPGGLQGNWDSKRQQRPRQDEYGPPSSRGASSPEPTDGFKGFPAKRPSLKRAVGAMLSRWVIVLFLIGGIYAVLYTFSSEPVLSKRRKRVFNALITGFSIGLALMVVSFMNKIVGDLRWFILSRRSFSHGKVEAILQAHSLTRIAKLIMSSKRLPVLAVASLWLFIALAAQIALASLGLCFSVENAEDKALLVPGRVLIRNMTVISTSSSASTSPAVLKKARQYTANSFGVFSQAYAVAGPEKKPESGDLYYADNPLYFCDPKLQQSNCSYVFHELNPNTINNNDRLPVTAATDRSIEVRTECRAFPVIEGGNGTQSNITIRLTENQRGIVNLPVRGGLDQNTYMTDMRLECGPRCAIVTMFEAAFPEAWWYNCTVSVGDVEGATRPEEKVGDELARMAAAGIALQGFASVSADAPSGVQNKETEVVVQSQVYPSENLYGTPFSGSATSLAAIMSRFATGVIAVAGENNEAITVSGMMPEIGNKLKMEHWPIIHVILIATATGLLVLGLTGVLLAHKIVIPQQSPIVEAQVLKSMVKAAVRYTEAGRRQKQSAEHRRGDSSMGRNSAESRQDKSMWIYKDKYCGNGIYDLYMEEVTPFN